jgi:hypothetical protein
MDDKRIEKRTRSVTVRLSDGSTVEGEVFVGLLAARHSGPERVGGVLNSDEDLIPVKTGPGVVLLNRDQIVLVRTDREDEDDELTTLGEARSVQIKTVAVGDIAGTVYVNLPQGSRVTDFFRQDLLFFPIFPQDDTVLYVNRRFILLIRD